MKLKVQGNEAMIEGAGADNFFSKLIAGTKGNVNLHTPFGKRKLKLVKKFKAKKK